MNRLMSIKKGHNPLLQLVQSEHKCNLELKFNLTSQAKLPELKMIHRTNRHYIGIHIALMVTDFFDGGIIVIPT